MRGWWAAGLHPNPVPYADVVTTTTHKTLRGPRGGMILCKEALAKQIDKAVFPGTQGGPLMHVIAAKAVCLGEALGNEFKEYQKQIVKNAAALADGLRKRGFNLVTGGTDNHLMLVDLQSFGVTGKELEKRLDEVYITVNKNAIPNDPKAPLLPVEPSRDSCCYQPGLKEEDMEVIAQSMYLAATAFDEKADEIRSMVTKLCDKYPLYE